MAGLVDPRDFCYLGRALVAGSAAERADNLAEIRERYDRERQMLAGTLAALGAAGIRDVFPKAAVLLFQARFGYEEGSAIDIHRLFDAHGTVLDISDDYAWDDPRVHVAEGHLAQAYDQGLQFAVAPTNHQMSATGYRPMLWMELADPLKGATFA